MPGTSGQEEHKVSDYSDFDFDDFDDDLFENNDDSGNCCTRTRFADDYNE